MPDTQAYSVDWDVTIQPEGNVSNDVTEIVITKEPETASATVTLDTSERPHALEEERDISITIEDKNDTVTFNGFTDAVQDHPKRPIVSVDARSGSGVLRDTTMVGVIDEPTVFEAIDAHVDKAAGKVRNITFDPQPLIDEYGTFSRDTNFGEIDVIHSGISFGVDNEKFTKGEVASEEKEAMLAFESYQNNLGETYTMDITGKDGVGNEVTASIDLPPGEDAETAFGSDEVKLYLSGGNQRWVEVTGFSTDIPSNLQSTELGIFYNCTIYNYVKTRWAWKVDQKRSVEYALNSVVSYLSGLDEDRTWEWVIDDAAQEVIVRPTGDTNVDRHVFQEGDNVIKPVAKRNLDGVRNFIKVIGSGSINSWAWAYNGTLYYTLSNPFENDLYPDSGISFGSSPISGRNDIDQINLRGETLESKSFTSVLQAIEIAKKGLREFIRTPVTGTAPVIGVKEVQPGDEAEIYYPSRGIPSNVSSNVYTVEQVEHTVKPFEAQTAVDFGTERPNVADIIRTGGGVLRRDIDQDIRQYATSIDQLGSGSGVGGAGDPFPVIGTLLEQNADNTWDVEGEDGEIYENVQVI